MPFARDRGLAHKLVRLRGSRQVCLRERIPGTPQPAGVRPGYKRAAGFLHPLRCYYPRKESEVKSRHNITIENRTRSAAGTAQRDRIPNLNPIGGRISTTQSNKTKIDRVSQPSRWNGKQDSTEVQTSEQGHAHLLCCHSLLAWGNKGNSFRGKFHLTAEPAWSNVNSS